MPMRSQRARIAPHHRVVPDNAAGRMIKRGQDRIARHRGSRSIARHELPDLLRVDHAAVDAEQLVVLRTHAQPGTAESVWARVRWPHWLNSRFQSSSSRHLLVQPQRCVVKRNAFGSAVVGREGSRCCVRCCPPQVALVEQGDAADAVQLSQIIRVPRPCTPAPTITTS